MRSASRLPSPKLVYLGSAFIASTVIAGVLRKCTSALVAIALVLCTKLSVTAQSVSSAIPDAPSKSAGIDARGEDSNERINSLIRKMTLAEKIGQLQQVNNVDVEGQPPANHRATEEDLSERIRKGRVGSILNEVDPSNINRLQKVAVESSRVGVPLIFGRDVIHGYRTIFPIPLGQAASWNPELVEQAAAIAASEARSVGIRWTFAPMVDIARDPRWGRIAESLGEDPCLASSLSAAMVKGFQSSDLSSADRIAACAKHFAGYGACEGGRDYNSAVISPALMQNVYLRPFRAAVDAGVATLMTSFNDVNGVPGSANKHLLREVLRNEWGFNGFVVSDWESIREMTVHGYCTDEKDAARTAARAGVNMEMVSQTYESHLPTLVRDGEISEALINELAADVLRVKDRLGLFEHPFVDATHSSPLAEDHLRLARQLARQSIVLLKNNDRVLPIDRSKVKKLAVIGPLADDKKAQLGAWVLDARNDDSRTPLDSIRETAGIGVEVLFASGLTDDLDRSKSKFGEAVAIANQADIVLLVVGEGADLSGEARSRAIIDLPGAQNDLVDAIAGTGKPIVLIVEAGRPLTIGRQIEKVKSVLYSFHAGTMAGPALADLIWGIEAPSGKLPVTIPKSVGQIPLYYNHASTGRPPRPYDFSRDGKIDNFIHRNLGNNSNYIDVSPYPLYPFGYGMSYTTFAYGEVKLSSTILAKGETLVIRAPVTNTGKLPGEEVSQLYIRNMSGGTVHEVRELKAFRRVHIEPGKTKSVQFSIPVDSLAFFDSQERRISPSGKFEIYLGGNSLAPFAAQFEVGK
jgi:beta-glucosidase